MGRPKILLADGNATVRAQVHQKLSGAGYEVVQATNGLAALQMAVEEPPALAILDIDLPALDGFAVCQDIRQMGLPWSEIPIVFLSASRSHALELLGEQLGAYIQKPTSPDVLLKVVQDLVSRRAATVSGTDERQCSVVS